MKKCLSLILMLFVLVGCQAGLEPLGNKLIGTVFFKNEWPPIDSVKDISVVAFKNYPPSDIISEVISGDAIFSESLLPYFQDSSFFSIEIPITPMTYKYIAVAQQYGTLFEWRAIGVYTNDTINFEPIPINISSHEIKRINIKVDFQKLPPQPF